MQNFLEKKISHNRKFVKQLKSLIKKIIYNPDHWIRYPTYKIIKEGILRLNPEKLNVIKISAYEYWKNNYEFKSSETLNYPNYDICENLELSKKYDLIITKNVWEYLKYPYKATKNVCSLLNNDGYLLIIVPFLIRIGFHKNLKNNKIFPVQV